MVPKEIFSADQVIYFRKKKSVRPSAFKNGDFNDEKTGQKKLLCKKASHR
jgi:hypothetical protein